MLRSLKQTTTPLEAISVLEGIAANAYSRVTSGVSASSYRPRYANWAGDAERELWSITSRPAAAAFFSSQRHFIVISQEHSDGSLVIAELNSICAELREAAESIKRAQQWLGNGGGQPLVIDTNVILEYLPVDQIDWSQVTESRARLIVPTRVLGELEAKRYDRSSRLDDVARAQLPRIAEWLESSAGPGVYIGDKRGTTIETVPIELEVEPLSDADTEILEFFDMVLRFAPEARLVTSDGPLRVRAHLRGYSLARVPETFRRPKAISASTTLAAAELEAG